MNATRDLLAKKKEIARPGVSLRRLRDATVRKDGTFPFPPSHDLLPEPRHLESTLNQFISFVFNHPTERSDRPRGEETTPLRAARKEIKGKTFDRENISPSTASPRSPD